MCGVRLDNQGCPSEVPRLTPTVGCAEGRSLLERAGLQSKATDWARGQMTTEYCSHILFGRTGAGKTQQQSRVTAGAHKTRGDLEGTPWDARSLWDSLSLQY